MPEETLLNLPTLTTISGKYFLRKYFHGGFALVSMHRTITALEKQIGEPVPGQKYYGLRARPWHSFAASCAFPVYDPRTRQADSGVSCAGCQLRTQERTHAGAVQDMPYTQFGHMTYLRDEFLEHFGTCEYAQKLWLESKEGTLELSSFPEACRRGDYARPPPSEWDRIDWNLWRKAILILQLYSDDNLSDIKLPMYSASLRRIRVSVPIRTTTSPVFQCSNSRQPKTLTVLTSRFASQVTQRSHSSPEHATSSKCAEYQ